MPKEVPARVGVGPGKIEWVAWDGRRVRVAEVLRWWDEPPAPWEGAEERHYARLLLVDGGVLEIFQEGDAWHVCGTED
jgi:hypothetical protein